MWDRHAALWDARILILYCVTTLLGVVFVCRISTIIELFVIFGATVPLAAPARLISDLPLSQATSVETFIALGWLAGVAILNLAFKSHWTRNKER